MESLGAELYVESSANQSLVFIAVAIRSSYDCAEPTNDETIIMTDKRSFCMMSCFLVNMME